MHILWTKWMIEKQLTNYYNKGKYTAETLKQWEAFVMEHCADLGWYIFTHSVLIRPFSSIAAHSVSSVFSCLLDKRLCKGFRLLIPLASEAFFGRVADYTHPL